MNQWTTISPSVVATALFGLFTFKRSARTERTVLYDRPMVLGRYNARHDLSKAGV